MALSEDELKLILLGTSVARVELLNLGETCLIHLFIDEETVEIYNCPLSGVAVMLDVPIDEHTVVEL
jgi:hypothetical protein